MWVLLVEVQLNARVDFASGTRRRACEPGMYYFSFSSPTMRRRQPKYIEGVGRKVGIFSNPSATLRCRQLKYARLLLHRICTHVIFGCLSMAKRLRTDVRKLHHHHLL